VAVLRWGQGGTGPQILPRPPQIFGHSSSATGGINWFYSIIIAVIGLVGLKRAPECIKMHHFEGENAKIFGTRPPDHISGYGPGGQAPPPKYFFLEPPLLTGLGRVGSPGQKPSGRVRSRVKNPDPFPSLVHSDRSHPRDLTKYRRRFLIPILHPG